MKASLQVLNIEDSAADAELNALRLESRWPGSEFLRVDNERALIGALETRKFDIILCDYSIPGFGGLEALKTAREKCPGTPFIFVSGTLGEDTAIESLKNGATDYVLKHRPARLIPAVERALREAADRAECERAEMAMRESEHKYRKVFESLDEGAFLADEETGKIIDTNRCAEEMLGCGRVEILGKKQPQFFEVPASANGKPFETFLTGPTGRVLRIHVHFTRLTLHGHPLVLWLCRDLSKQ